MTSTRTPEYFFLRKTARILISAIIRTCRLSILGEERVLSLRERKIPLIYTFWHRHIFVTIFRFRGTGARPLISHSRDGEIVARVAIEFGMNPVRGSSSSGGARAFLKLAESIRNHKAEILITADGPKGPLREIKDGTILLARKTGSAIVPICWHASRVKIFKKSWDRFQIPLPFSHITFSYGEPFLLPPESKGTERGKQLENLKQELRDRMVNLEKQTEALYKK